MTSTSTEVAEAPPQAHERRRASIWARAQSLLVSRELLWLVVVVGVIVRVRQYVANRSLWLDESFFALNVINRSLHGLLTVPLDFNQASPAGFLVVEKLATELFGKSEHALRAFPLLWGIASLPLFAMLARRVLAGLGAAIAAAAMFAVGGPLIYYSSEVKPYAGDVAATIAFLLIGLEVLEGRCRIRRCLGFGFVGFMLIQLTYAGILAAAGVGTGLVIIWAIDRRWKSLRRGLLMLLPWALSALTFLLTYVENAHSKFVQGGSFAPLPLSGPDLSWYFHRLTYVALDANLYARSASPLVVVTLLTALLALLGAISLVRENWRWFVIVISPVVATVLASGAEKYPMIARTILFFAPIALLLITNGAVAVERNVRPLIGKVAVAAALATLLLHASFANGHNVLHSAKRSEIKQSLDYVARHWRTGDVLYLQYATQYAFTYYVECGCFDLPNGRGPESLWPVRRVRVRDHYAQFPPAVIPESPALIVGFAATKQRQGDYARDASLIAKDRRAWILVTFYSRQSELKLIKSDLLGRLDRRGRRVASIFLGGTRLYLYDFPSQ